MTATPSRSQGRPLPLHGIRVIDLTRVLSGPFCTALLGDLGAEVTKVEPASGDDYRHVGPFLRGESVIFQLVNRNKASITLDLKSATGLAELQALVREADVFVENFRPGVTSRLGIDYAALSAINDRLVYVSISGFGQEGAYADRPAYDPIMQALTGLMTTTGQPDGPPTMLSEAFGDTCAGLFAAFGAVAALLESIRSGKGQHVDVAMLDSLFTMQPMALSRYLSTGEAPPRVGNRHPTSAPFGVFGSADGNIVIAVLNERLFADFCRVIGRPELAADPRFGSDPLRCLHEAALRECVEGWSRPRSTEACLEALQAAGIPCAPVWSIKDLIESPLASARGLLHPVEHPVLGTLRLAQQPIRFSAHAREAPNAAPPLPAQRKPRASSLLDEERS
jgi:CoA:oxalate CoA-transferase